MPPALWIAGKHASAGSGDGGGFNDDVEDLLQVEPTHWQAFAELPSALLSFGRESNALPALQRALKLVHAPAWNCIFENKFGHALFCFSLLDQKKYICAYT
jgi:hypothetical protein